MKRIAFAVFLSTAAFAAQQSPSDFLKMPIGADKPLADYKQISSYFDALAAGSPRVRIENLGKTTLGADEIMAVITSEENMKHLDRIKEIAKRLSDPRGLSDDEVNALVREGKATIVVRSEEHTSELQS